MAFFTELRRRNVIRVAALYLVTAWLLLQMADVGMSSLGLPEWTARFVFLILAIGVVPVLVFSWAYEITPAGIKREHEVDRSQSITHLTARRLDLLTIAAALLAVAALLADRLVERAPIQASAPSASTAAMASDATQPVATDASIAVLPFVNMSSDPEQEYFSDGLSEELLNLLAKIPKLRVIARTSSFSYKGQDVTIADVGRDLNVAHVLEGSVRRSGDRLRITAQLIRTSDSSHLWSEAYDRDIDDVFKIQDEIARAVTQELEVRLLGSALPAHGGTRNAEAHNLFLRGQFLADQRTPGSSEKALELFRQATVLDPDYALAWTGIARMHPLIADSVASPLSDTHVLAARVAARRALELEPDLPDAHRQMAWIEYLHDWDWAAADRSLQRALQLDPGNVRTISMAAFLAHSLGRHQQAIELRRRALVLDPLQFDRYMLLAFSLIYAGDLSAAEAEARRGLELKPDFESGHQILGLALLLQGRNEEALAEFQTVKSGWQAGHGLALAHHALGHTADAQAALESYRQAHAGTSAYQIAQMHAFRGESEQAFEWLERAYRQRDGGLTDMKGDPLLKNLFADPRYTAFLKRMNLPI